MTKSFLTKIFILLGCFATGQFNCQAQVLGFDPQKFVSQKLLFQGKELVVRAYEKIPYVSNPSDPNKQVMNIYIPEAYFLSESINGYTANTAPIFFPNRIGGYMPADPATFLPPAVQNGPNSYSNATILFAISRGYIVASPGARGRISKDSFGKMIGKAPACVVDVKAAIRFLKSIDQQMPGDVRKIISNGTSAGGAISVQLGASGNHPDYEELLQQIGAANARDDIFAVSAYCPITNLEHADMAYEWQFNGMNSFDFRGRKGELNADEKNVSSALKKSFPDYVNGLQLKNDKGEKLFLDPEGNGNFKDLLKSYLIASAQTAIKSGVDLSSYTFLKIRDHIIQDIDFDQYLQFIGRMKTPPAFDALAGNSFENNLFGTNEVENAHFTEFSWKYSTLEHPKLADKNVVKMMNPMEYLLDKKAVVSKHWRIRHGAKDRDTGFAVPIILSTLLKNKGYAVDVALPWDRPHSGDYDLVELFDWMDGICK